MVPRIAALLGLTLLSAHAEIDFTPVTRQVTFEGTACSQTAFRNGAEMVSYEPPAGWSLQGQGARLELRPKDVPLASARIESRPLRPGSVLDDTLLETLRKEVAAGFPREAEAVTWEPVELNPLLLNRHETRRLTVTYAAFGQRFKSMVLICNFAQQQITFRLDTRADDFEKQYEAFRRSLYTWQGLP